MKKKVAVLISGRGSNLKALFAASKNSTATYEISKVISNRPDAGGIEWAASNGLNVESLDHKSFDSKADFETALNEELVSANIDFVCLAGFMRLLSAAFVKRWHGKILNIHPSLLPSFEGLAPQQQALDVGACISGCTVHFVSEKMDGGPIIAQVAVPVLSNDTEGVLSARILKAEHSIYAKALAAVCSGHVTWLQGNKVIVSEGYSSELYGFLVS